MADAAEVLEALDFTIIVLCSSKKCWQRATLLVHCSNLDCPFAWRPACAGHLAPFISDSRTSRCRSCKKVAPMRDLFITRPL
ncbi:hypothetical protein C5B97_11955 [Pseudoclavibacter sp. RFBB5]|nr:hypothetical protein C5B97_11955 [Pseudoclavibacter sp. RFBB5]